VSPKDWQTSFEINGEIFEKHGKYAEGLTILERITTA
tara:strand:+ start:729 stop:839 length:111 start_codon:yes stop_codon:yes gene_type:complete